MQTLSPEIAAVLITLGVAAIVGLVKAGYDIGAIRAILEGRVSTVESGVEKLEHARDGHEGRLHSLETTIAGHEVRISWLEEDADHES